MAGIIGSYADYKAARAYQAKHVPQIIGTREVVINGATHVVKVCSAGVPYGAFLGQCGEAYVKPEQE